MKKIKLMISTFLISATMMSMSAIDAYAATISRLSRVQKSGNEIAIAIDDMESQVKGFQMSLKIEGDVSFKDIEWSNDIKTKGKSNVKYNEAENTVDIYVTSKENLVNDKNDLEVGTIKINGKENVKYNIKFNDSKGNDAFKAVSMTYNEITYDTLQNVGDGEFTYSEVSGGGSTGGGTSGSTNNKPIIVADNITIKLNEKFDPLLGVTASDKEDGDITKSIKVISNNVDTSKEGSYKVIYEVKDNNGNVTTKEITVTVSKNVLNVEEIVGSTRYETATKLSKYKFDKANTVVITNGFSLADGLTVTPLASYLKAPILLTTLNDIPDETIREIERLGADNIIIVGGEGVVSKKIEEKLNKVGINKIERLGGKTRYETSLAIAKYIDENCYDVENVVVAGGFGEADALSIASVSGKENMPIILSTKDEITSETHQWLKSEKLKNAYIVGGDGVVSEKVITEVNKITSNDVSSNRLGGKTRYETNAIIIEKFYDDKLDKAYITKGFELVDALSAGPVAALDSSPVIISNNDLSKEQESVLSKKSSSEIIQIGGGVSKNVLESLKSILK
ncbi:cell wall-binding repeat-containing protein [Clostridium ihumii]|uniref:cell wall-binding repeat-containing protein n=1 Tax=Clostridium ihumii TaxID=1470356 RepID=UPI000684793E|nr:cell wall-binding repeat-containing protein [Clostridium ihumii]